MAVAELPREIWRARAQGCIERRTRTPAWPSLIPHPRRPGWGRAYVQARREQAQPFLIVVRFHCSNVMRDDPVREYEEAGAVGQRQIQIMRGCDAELSRA